jgi:hypothetical protein
MLGLARRQAMSEIYTTGDWMSNPGNEEAFVEASAQFAVWSRDMSAAGRLQLVR